MAAIHVALSLALAMPAPRDVDGIEATRDVAVKEEQLVFCSDPSTPLGPRQRQTCEMARGVEGCAALVKVCDAEVKPPDMDWLGKLARWLAPIAQVLLYGLMLVIAIAVAIPVISGLLQLRRRRRKRDSSRETPNIAQVMTTIAPPVPGETEPEEALRQADELLARGEYRRSLLLALSASLGALGRRGALRLGKDRTNGEYVRSCTETAARPPLREIVRAVDAVEFGGAEATQEKAAHVARAARAIVLVTALGLLLLGCDPPKKGSDPAGDELPIAVLARNGYQIKPLGSSLATLPVPESADEGTPVVVIDVERVALEDETQAHLLRWVEAGGVLVLFGQVGGWPSELGAKHDLPSTRELTVEVPDPDDGLSDLAPPDDDNAAKPISFQAHVGRYSAFSWKGTDHQVLAKLGDAIYAAKRSLGKGFVLGVANDDLWTNIGVMPKHNAAALVTLIRSVSHDPRRELPVALGKTAPFELRVARPEDGVPPPSNPFASLIAAGLGKASWHALAAAALLFLCYGVRHARPRRVPSPPRRAFVEHIEATGAFYARTSVRSHALAAYGRFVELRLRELAPRGTDPTTFLASRTGAAPDHVARLIARSVAAKTDQTPTGDELEIIGELRSLLARALLKTRSEDE